MSGYPIVIVSGLALGIDATIAHSLPMRDSRNYSAVPGSKFGDDVLYPVQTKFSKKILDAGGALVSEFGKTEQLLITSHKK